MAEMTRRSFFGVAAAAGAMAAMPAIASADEAAEGIAVGTPVDAPANTEDADIVVVGSGIGGFFAAMFGPLAGFLVAFIGHALSDIVQYGSAWWSWVVASGVAGFIMGLVFPRLHVEDGVLTGKDILMYNVFQVVANAVAWIGVAPILDILVYAEDPTLVFVQGAVAALSNAISAGVIGTLLLVLYSKTRAQKGSLTKE